MIAGRNILESATNHKKQQSQQGHETHTNSIEGGDGRVSSLPSVPVQSPMAMVETTWKPTILVVDDSPMNRKVRNTLRNQFLFHHHFFPPNLFYCPPKSSIINVVFWHITLLCFILPLDAGPYVDLRRFCLL